MIKCENTPILETERLILRKFIQNDLNDMFNIFSDKDVNKFLPWFPFKSMEETKNHFENVICEEYKKTIAYYYAIEEKETKKVIGYINLSRINKEKCCAELGYGLLKQYWNKGIITEASKILLKYAKESGFNYITATHDVNNPRSGKVMEKIGMTFRYSYYEQCQPKNFKVKFNLYQIDFN